jgi:hypothetical protein
MAMMAITTSNSIKVNAPALARAPVGLVLHIMGIIQFPDMIRPRISNEQYSCASPWVHAFTYNKEVAVLGITCLGESQRLEIARLENRASRAALET